MRLQYREHQDPVRGIKNASQQHAYRTERHQHAARGNRGKVIWPGNHGLDEDIPAQVENEPSQVQHAYNSGRCSIEFLFFFCSHLFLLYDHTELGDNSPLIYVNVV